MSLEQHPSLRRSRRLSFMLSGWIRPWPLGPEGGGTACVTLGCPTDFHAVRIGLANVTAEPWHVSRVIARASAAFNDHVRPSGDSAWTDLTFAMQGRDDDRVVTLGNAPVEIEVRPCRPDPATGTLDNPAWTFSDWVPLRSLAPDPGTGQRVLMLRALIPPNQVVGFANGLLRSLTDNPAVNLGYDYFVGGLKRNFDRVSKPEIMRETRHEWAANTPFPGSVIPLVQFLTARDGVVGLTAGDSHQQGTGATEQFTNYLFRASARLSHELGEPFSMVNCAKGGLTSPQFFARMDDLMPSVAPSYAVLPGWTFNDRHETVHADRVVVQMFFARLLRAIERCHRHGVLPIVLTPFPRDPGGMGKVQVEAWQWVRGEVLALAGPDVVVLDAAQVLGAEAGGVLTGTYKPEMSQDQAHPNDAGHAALADLLVDAIKARLKR